MHNEHVQAERAKRDTLVFVVVAGPPVTGVALGAQRQAPPHAPTRRGTRRCRHSSTTTRALARVLTGEFRGSFNGPNTVAESAPPRGAYPSGYNMSYLNENAAFIQGGSYGDVEGSIGPFVAKVDPQTLAPVWYTQLRNTVEAGEWDYPGAMAIMNDGYIYVVSGYRIYKVDPADGSVVDTLVLPTMVLHAQQLS